MKNNLATQDDNLIYQIYSEVSSWQLFVLDDIVKLIYKFIYIIEIFLC